MEKFYTFHTSHYSHRANGAEKESSTWVPSALKSLPSQCAYFISPGHIKKRNTFHQQLHLSSSHRGGCNLWQSSPGHWLYFQGLASMAASKKKLNNSRQRSLCSFASTDPAYSPKHPRELLKQEPALTSPCDFGEGGVVTIKWVLLHCMPWWKGKAGRESDEGGNRNPFTVCGKVDLTLTL